MQVLVLRTGLGLKHGYTRRQVARILRVTPKQEGRIERRAMIGLKAASAQGRCGKPANSIPVPVLRAVNALLVFTGQLSATGGNTAGTPILVSSTAQRGGSASHGGAGSAPKATPQPPAANVGGSAAISPPRQSSGVNLVLPLLALAAALTLLWLVLARLREQPEGGVVASRQTATPHAVPALIPGRRMIDREPLPAASTRPNGGPAEATPPSTATSDEPPAEPDPTTLPATHAPLLETAAAGAALGAGFEAFEHGGTHAERGDMAAAEEAFRRADQQGHPAAASNLGVLLEQRGDLTGAEAAYRRADERGDAIGAFNLGAMLQDRGDLLGAEAAYRRADQRADAAGAFQLGALLEGRNDLFGAEAAFRRADERGDAAGAFRLGALLEKRRDLSGAEAAYARAAERGQSYVAELAHAALNALRADR